MKTLDQEYATIAFEKVSEIKDSAEMDKSFCQKYGTMAHKLPVLIRKAGLAQALSFVASRNEDAHTKLLDHLAISLGLNNSAAIISKSKSDQLSDYMYLSRRALSALVWYKRFAESLLDVSQGSEGNKA